MKYSIILWVSLFITAIVLCRLFPIIEHDVITYLIFMIITTRAWKYIIFKRVPKRFRCENQETALVTGCSSGIGSEIALHLWKRGAKVIWTARDVRKAETKLCDVPWSQELGPRGYVMYLDLAELKEIEQFVQRFKSREKKLNLLVLNAAYHGPYKLTVDGYEQTIGVNHLGHMYLCYLLLDLLKQSAPSRIVVVASDLHQRAKKLRFDDLMFKTPHSYTSWAAYNQSKLLNIMFVKELSRRIQGTGITVHAAHPGTPVVTGLMRDNVLSNLLVDQFLLRPLGYFYCRSTTEACQTPLYCCVSPECAQNTGLYFENCRPAKPSLISQDAESAAKMWDISCDLLKIKRDW